MTITVHDKGDESFVRFTQGVQTFTLDYYATLEECTWMAKRLKEALDDFADVPFHSAEAVIRFEPEDHDL